MREQREKHGKKNKTSKQDNKCHCYRFRAPPIELSEKLVGFRAIVAHVPFISQTGTLPHDLPFSFLLSSTAASVRLPPVPPSPRFPLVAALSVLCCVL